MNLLPYPEYKDSDVEWIGDIPKHWEVRRLKSIAKVVLGKMLKTSPSKGDQLKSYLRSANIQWFEANVSDVASMWFSPVEMKHYRISKNDILVSEGGEVGRACIWKDELEECYIQNSVHKVTAGVEILPHFLLYHFSTFGDKGVFKAIVNRVSIAHLTREKLVTVSFCKPPLEEQTQIARFLNWKTSQINKFIRNKRRLIALLKEQKQNIINQVVTGKCEVRRVKGENGKERLEAFPTSPLKLRPSNVEWIGDIPEHWEVSFVRRCAKLVKTGGTPPGAGDQYFSTPGFNWFTPGDFKESLYLANSERQLSETGRNCVKLFPPNTVMMIGIGGTIGKVSISREQASCNQQINAIVPNERVNVEYLALALRCLKNFVVSCGKFTTMPIINQEKTKSLLVPVPPMTEQIDIVQNIDAKSLIIDHAITRAEREIELMREYRTRLISDVVTGKVDVRGIEVPEVAEDELLPLEEDDAATAEMMDGSVKIP